MNDTGGHTTPIRELMANRGYWKWSLATQLMRMPAFMSALGFVTISLSVTGHQQVGGMMITAFVISASVLAVPMGRLVDRIGQARATWQFSLASSLVFLGLAVAIFVHSSPPVLVGVACLGGILSSARGMRPLLSAVVPTGLVRSALSLDATILEITVAVSPLIITVVARWSLLYIPAAMSLCYGLSALIVWKSFGAPSTMESDNASPTSENVEDDSTAEASMEAHRGGALWRNRTFWFWLLLEFSIGHIFGTIESGILPWTLEVGERASAAGVALTVLSVSSGIGGLIYMRLNQRFSLRVVTEALSLFIFVEVGCLLFSLSDRWGIGMAGMVVIGLCTAPLNGVISAAVSLSMPPSRQSEGFAALSSVNTAGYGLGGIFLALLPLHWMMLSTVITGVAVVCVVPALIANRPIPYSKSA